MTKRVAILGSTGSVGRQTLSVIADNPDRLSVCALGCRNRVDDMMSEAVRFGVKNMVCPNMQQVDGFNCFTGEHAMRDYAAYGDYDVLVVSVVGIAGLAPTLAAIQRGKTVCLANKETLVCGGPLVCDALATAGGQFFPIDSEHSAIMQCISASPAQDVKRIILTASGGALRDMPLADLSYAVKEDVLRHPNWSMGDKITVDCATMVNKGFEVIEAHYLFAKAWDDIDILLHRQSIVHSMVQFADNSVMAQMAVPDMRLPIQYALLGAKRAPSMVAELDLTLQPLTFEQVDIARYPALEVVLQAARRSSAQCVAVNAADEVAVDAFLQGHIEYGRIHTILRQTTEHFDGEIRDYLDVTRIDREARRLAKEGIC